MSKEDQTITLKDGRKLGFAEYGDPKGKPIFYFHGWPSSRLQPKIIDEIASKQNIRLISIDRPGYGLSSYKKERTILDWPNDVEQLANQLNIRKFAIMGVSGGGPYAAVCAYKIPQRLTKTAIVVGLGPTWISSNLDGVSSYAKFLWGNYATYPILRYASGVFYYMLAKYFPPLFTIWIIIMRSSSDKKASFQLLREYKNKIITNTKETFRQGWIGPVLDLYLYTKDWRFDLKKICTPVYLFYGQEDKNVSANTGEYYHQQIPRSVLKTYPKEGHMIAITHAKEILKTLVQ